MILIAGEDIYLDDFDISSWDNIVNVAIGTTGGHVVGLKRDGTVVATGDNEDNQCNVTKWKDIVQIAAGGLYTLGLRQNGTVVVVGKSNDKICRVSDWKNIVKIFSTTWGVVGLKSDGTLISTEASSNNEYMLVSGMKL